MEKTLVLHLRMFSQINDGIPFANTNTEQPREESVFIRLVNHHSLQIQTAAKTKEILENLLMSMLPVGNGNTCIF